MNQSWRMNGQAKKTPQMTTVVIKKIRAQEQADWLKSTTPLQIEIAAIKILTCGIY